MLLELNWFTGSALAGGSGLNTLVVINQNSSNSVALGNYFCERRQVPPENVVRIAWSGWNISWDGTQFQTNLLQPLLAAISSRGLSNQIQYVVLSMDIPYSTIQSNVYNGTTSGLFYGLKLNAAANSYSGSEAVFSDATPATAQGYSFLATMITDNSLAEAKRLVDQGVNSDSTFPTAPVVLAKTYDTLRRIRYTMFDNAMFNTRLRGNYSVIRKNANSMYGETNLLGYQTGLMTLTVPTNVFAPGAMADSLTSYGGVIFGNNDQTSLLAFIHGGAAGSYGTVAEPTATTSKFPNPQNYFYQSRGFSLAECYYQSLDIPYQGLIVGEPLAAPFAVAASGSWSGIAPNEILAGTRSLAVQFTAADATRPLQRIDLFVDGKFFQTLTNVTPAAGNQISVRLGNLTINQTVPANATLTSLATSLAATLNSPANSNATRT
ncbi:MAG: TIGR03790 family protein, partial [Verrucomicrobiales bacterium]